MLSIKLTCNHLQGCPGGSLKLTPPPRVSRRKTLSYPPRRQRVTSPAPMSPYDLRPRRAGKLEQVDELGARYSLGHPHRGGRSLVASRLPVSRPGREQGIARLGSQTEPRLNPVGRQSVILTGCKEVCQGHPARTQLLANRDNPIAARVHHPPCDPAFFPKGRVVTNSSAS